MGLPFMERGGASLHKGLSAVSPNLARVAISRRSVISSRQPEGQLRDRIVFPPMRLSASEWDGGRCDQKMEMLSLKTVLGCASGHSATLQKRIGRTTVCFRVQRTFGTPLFSGLGGQIRLIF